MTVLIAALRQIRDGYADPAQPASPWSLALDRASAMCATTRSPPAAAAGSARRAHSTSRPKVVHGAELQPRRGRRALRPAHRRDRTGLPPRGGGPRVRADAGAALAGQRPCAAAHGGARAGPGGAHRRRQGGRGRGDPHSAAGHAPRQPRRAAPRAPRAGHHGMPMLAGEMLDEARYPEGRSALRRRPRARPALFLRRARGGQPDLPGGDRSHIWRGARAIRCPRSRSPG